MATKDQPEPLPRFLQIRLQDQEAPILFRLLELTPSRFTFDSIEIYYTLYNILHHWCQNNSNISKKIENRKNPKPTLDDDATLHDRSLSLVNEAQRIKSKSIERTKKNYQYFIPTKNPREFSLRSGSPSFADPKHGLGQKNCIYDGIYGGNDRLDLFIAYNKGHLKHCS
jgi:WD40 repeat protein